MKPVSPTFPVKPAPSALLFAVVQVGFAKMLVLPAKLAFYGFQFFNRSNAWLCARAERNSARFQAWLDT